MQDCAPELLGQIEGFKLHLSHNIKPFTSRIRYAPEIASRPDRLAKDLASAKELAKLLEEEYDRIRRPTTRDPPPQDGSSEPNVPSEPPEDTLMGDGSLGEDPDEDAPKSRGSEAVEQRIEKVISELKESDAVGVMSEREFEAKKVKFHPLSDIAFPHSPTPLHHSTSLQYAPFDKKTAELTFVFACTLNRMPLRWTCTFHTFEQPLTHAFTARLLPIMSKSCKENV